MNDTEDNAPTYFRKEEYKETEEERDFRLADKASDVWFVVLIIGLIVLVLGAIWSATLY